MQQFYLFFGTLVPMANLVFYFKYVCDTIQHIVEAMKKVTGVNAFVPEIPNWIIMPLAAIAKCMGSPMGICPARVKKLQISTNICGSKLKNSGYDFKWSFEEALNDWFEDNEKEGLM